MAQMCRGYRAQWISHCSYPVRQENALNHQKVSGLYLLNSNQDMAVFSKGLGLKNDIFWSRPFLTPLSGSKTSTNIWKHVGISQSIFQDTKSNKIGLLDKILALLQKFLFSTSFPSGIWPFSGLKNCSRWPTMVLFVPQVRYLGTLISFHRYPGPLDTKIWNKLEKMKKYRYFRQHLWA